MAASGFASIVLRLFSAPIIWAMHFLAIYAGTGILCARPAWRREWLGIDAITFGICLASAVAIACIGFMHLRDRRLRIRCGDPGFTHWLASGLGMLSVIAILWETIPAFLVPVCG